MKNKAEIVTNWLPRYTDTPLEEFGKYILLTNFDSYVQEFAKTENAEPRGAMGQVPRVAVAKEHDGAGILVRHVPAVQARAVGRREPGVLEPQPGRLPVASPDLST